MTVARTLVRRIATTVAVAAAVAACTGGPPASVGPSPTREPEPTPVTTSYEIGTTVWYEGLVIRVDRATSILDFRGGPVEVTLTVANPNADPAEMQAKIFLRVGGQPVEATRESRVPPIPAEGEVQAVMTYELQSVTTVAEASVQVGHAPDHVALAPLTAAGGSAVTFEPRELTLAGEGVAGNLRIKLKGGLQRWDLPDWQLELPAVRQAISVTFDATFTGGFTGGFPFNAGVNVALRLPDGTDVAPRADGHSRPVELIGPERTKRNLTTRFEIPADVAGTVSFVVIDGKKEDLIPVVIPG